jgi:DNA polymerase-3 subunit alpha
MMAALDRAMEAASSAQRSKLEGQRSLLDLLAQEEGGKPDESTLPELEEWPASQLLAMEKDVLGFYLSGHPLRDFKAEIEKLATCSIEDLSQRKDRDRVVLCGIVGSIKKISTKNGGQMAFLTLEDLSGSVEVVVFPDLYANVSSHLIKDLPLLVTGNLDVTEDAAKLLASEIAPLSEVKGQGTSRAIVFLEGANCSSDLLIPLRQILSRHSGDCPVYLHLRLPQGEDVVIAAGNRFLVSANEGLRRDLEMLLGNGCVTFS